MAVQTAETRSTLDTAWRGIVFLRGARIPWIPVIVLLVLAICALFAPWLAPYDPQEPDVLKGVQRIAPFETSENPLGVDLLGRDILSRLIYGARISAFISLISLGFGALVGTALGVASGYLGGKIDAILMRVCDGVMGFPTILLALIIVAIQGGAGIQNVVIAIMATVWARFARQVRGEVLSIKERDFVTLAIVAGVPPHVIMWRHIFPQRGEHRARDHQPAGGADDSAGGVAKLPGGGRATRGTGVGHHGLRRPEQSAGPVVAVADAGVGDYRCGDGAQLVRRLAARHAGPEIAAAQMM